MALHKMEIQQMLREMNVKFHADETYDQLKQRLQQENHSRWLKSVSAEPSTPRQAGKILLRKRKKQVTAESPFGVVPESPKTAYLRKGRASRDAAPAGRRLPSGFHARPIEKPGPGKPWKAAADGTEPFNRKKKVFESVLKRAGRSCENCAARDVALSPYHILPLDQGGEHSIKNVVALCPACLAAIQEAPNPKVIKMLKRKTRARIYDSLQVVRKKKGCRWKRDSRRRY
ncbi:MAG: hypothetical protein CSA23_03305 [Deltaproteobacteria bacterium]|nr:MAG: hypothetical protein CSA23_03305 [Deltaproteobacteria bacterium]